MFAFVGLAALLGLFIALALAYVFPDTNYWILILVGTVIAAGGMLFFGDRASKKQDRDVDDYRKTKRIEELERRLSNIEGKSDKSNRRKTRDD